MIVIFIIITIIFIIDYICNFINYLSAKKLFYSKNNTSIYDKSTIYLLIPVYKEEKIIKRTIDNFSKLDDQNLKIIIIATAKEVDNKTYELAQKYIKNKKNFCLIKYENKTGTMASQLNYAIEYINSIEKGNYIIGIYNADSKISNKNISFVRNKINDNNCIQQYSYFNHTDNCILNEAISWQNRWSVIFEAGRCNNEIINNMNYVIGHGLFIKRNLITKCGYFPEDTINEDAFLGVILNYLNVKIIPMPYFENADFAPNIKVYIKQQSVWWNGPKQSYLYFIKLLKGKNNNKYKRNLKNINIFKLFIICFKLNLHAIYWLFGIYVLLFIYAISAYKIFNIYGIIFVIFINYLNVELWNYLSYKIIKKTNPLSKVYFNYIKLPLIFYFIHSLGPILNILNTLLGYNTINSKYKTER